MKKLLNRKVLVPVAAVLLAAAGLVCWRVIVATRNRVQIELNVHINRESVYLSTYAEPPQFAVWLENPETGSCQIVFVTYRVSRGDWEGKADVPVALPRWNAVFRGDRRQERSDDEIAVSGATPKDEYFRVRAEVKPGSTWILWIEMNLAGDYNDAYRQFDPLTMQEDEYSCGQPALLYRAEIRAVEGAEYVPELTAMSLWKDGVNTIVPVDATVTTARNVFDAMSVRLIRPRPVIIDTKRLEEQEVLK
jgi:hypothetical protein